MLTVNRRVVTIGGGFRSTHIRALTGKRLRAFSLAPVSPNSTPDVTSLPAQYQVPMNMNLLRNLVIAAAIATAPLHANGAQLGSQAQLSSILGATEVIENFEGDGTLPSGQLTTTSGSINSTNSPWISKAGATYSATQLYLNDNGYYALITRTLGDSASGRPITISYGLPTSAMGFDLQGYSGYCSAGTVEVYDTSNVLLGSISVSAGQFFGWENPAGIGHVTISAPGPECYLMIDNHGYGRRVSVAVPTLSYWGKLAIAILLVLLGGYYVRRKRLSGS